MNIKRLALLLALLVSFSANAQYRISNNDFKELVNRMEGDFDSDGQAQTDSSYYNIRLHMREIWSKNSKSGYWLYVEQVLASMPEKPYRQRIYHLTRKDNETIESKVYELPSPERFVGAWRNEDKMKKLSKDSLIDRQGCSIFLKIDEDGNFWGSTPGKECLSTLRGATYATSEVKIYPNMLISWDRGWDAGDRQVWGAEKAGYRFRKWRIYQTGE